jgi:hypothetical protein
MGLNSRLFTSKRSGALLRQLAFAFRLNSSSLTHPTDVWPLIIQSDHAHTYILGTSSVWVNKHTMLTTVAELGCVHYLCRGVASPTITESLPSAPLKGIVAADGALWIVCSKSCDNLPHWKY